MRAPSSVVGLLLSVAVAACEPTIYVDEPLQATDASTPGADAEAVADADTSPPEPAPQIRCAPEALVFGAVLTGSTETLLITCSNTGDEPLVITQVQLAGANPAFAFNTDRGTLPVMLAPAASVGISVAYTPLGSALDSDTLLISSNDPHRMEVGITLSGGSVPGLRVEPSDTVNFSTSGRSVVVAQLMISNVGLGDLLVQSVAITGPGGAAGTESIDDFAVSECMGQSSCTLTPALTLCPPASASCTGPDSHLLTVRYQNNDVSTVDYAELHVRTNDPSDADHVVVLNAVDIPCLFPTPVITVLTSTPCAGRPVSLSGASSSAGGGAISTYAWSWLFTPASPPAFNPSLSTSSTTTFTPTESGTHIVALDITNDCGGQSQASASAAIEVAAVCP